VDAVLGRRLVVSFVVAFWLGGPRAFLTSGWGWHGLGKPVTWGRRSRVGVVLVRVPLLTGTGEVTYGPCLVRKIFQDSPSHRILRHMYGALNIYEKKTICTVHL